MVIMKPHTRRCDHAKDARKYPAKTMQNQECNFGKTGTGRGGQCSW